MSRIKLALTIGALTCVAAATGGAAALLLAPASGEELRRRLAWRAEDQRRALARACARTIARATDVTKQEFERRRAEVMSAMRCEHESASGRR